MLHLVKIYLFKIKVKRFFIKHKIQANFKINDDFSVDVDDYVDLNNKKLNEIPFQFGTITGGFDCSNNHLESLKNSPKVVIGNFKCKNNLISSFDFAPEFVSGSFVISGSSIDPTQNLEVNDVYAYFSEGKFAMVAPWFKDLPKTEIQNFLVFKKMMISSVELKGLTDAKALAKKVLDFKEKLDWSLNISKSIPHKPFKI